MTDDGQLDARHVPDAGDLTRILDIRRGRVLTCATPERRSYFAWHRVHHSGDLTTAEVINTDETSP